jgi:hypothetical protein
VSADLTFTFSANVGTLNEGIRLGVDSSFNQGTNGSNSISQGETVQIDVSALVTAVPSGQMVTGLDFGIATIDLVRPSPSNGSNGYIWDSSAINAPFISPYTNATGGQPVETMDGANMFDILNATYSGQFSVDDNGDNNVSGFRFVTNADNVNFNFVATTASAPVPEPASFLVWVLFGMGVVKFARRRRAAQS